ncbi:MAG: VOC family protein [Synoicihabitans sp.]
MPIITTLGFTGRTEEALDFYKEALEAKTTFLMRFRDCPDQSYSKAGMEDLIFHATFEIEGTVFMASDAGWEQNQDHESFAGFSLAIGMASIERAKTVFSALSQKGQVVIPLEKSEFTSWYGIVIDQFGVSWKINVDESDR